MNFGVRRPQHQRVTKEGIDDWKVFKSKKKIQGVLVELKKTFVEAKKKVKTGDCEPFWTLIYELLWSRLTWGPHIPVGSWCAQTIAKPFPEDCARVIVDVFDVVFDEMTSRDKVKQLQTISSELTKEECISETFFKSHCTNLEIFLTESDRQRVKGSRTQFYYKQDTYNLFLEDSEGFAKLIAYFGEVAAQDLQVPAERFMNKIEHIVGRFNLNTDRVLDCVLHALELNPHNNLLLDYLRTERIYTISQILGFKYEGFTLPETANTPKSLYNLTIILHEQKLIDLEMVIPHLSPSLEDTINKRYEVEKEERDAACHLLKHNLNESDNDRAKRQKQESQAVQKRKKMRLEESQNHQLFELLGTCLQPETFDMELAKRLFDLLEAAVPASRLSIREAVCNILRDLVEPVYKEHYPEYFCLHDPTKPKPPSKTRSSGPKPAPGWTLAYFSSTGLDDFPGKVLPLLRWLNVYACANPEVCSLIARVLAQCAKLNPDENTMSQIQEVCCILCGAFSSMTFNTGIADDLWSIISQLRFEKRYAIYGFWKETIYLRYSEMFYIRNEEIKNTKYFMKRWHVDEEDSRKVGRKIARIVHHNPTIVLDEILTQLQSYNKNITMLAEAMRYFNHLTQDILIWVILLHMEKSIQGPPRTMITNEGVPSRWFAALSSLLAHFCKRTSSGEVDISPIVQYVINKLKCGSTAHLQIFTSTISQISGIEAFGRTINDDQLEALAGSKLLRFLAIHNDSKGPSRRTMIKACMKQMYDENQIIPLFILLCQMKDFLSSGNIDDEIENRYPICADLIDRVNDCFVQLHSFLESYEGILGKNDIYNLGRILPSLAELIQQYGMSPEYAFLICRRYFSDLRISATPPVEVVDLTSDASEISDPTQALHRTCELLLDPEALSGINPSFYASFWAYGLGDINVPTMQYAAHIEKLQSQIKHLPPSKEKEIKRLENDLETLRKDQEQQQKTVKLIEKNYLKAKHETWFSDVSSPEKTNRVILFKCIIPRLAISDVDSKYCAHFILFMTSEGTPGFNMLDFTWEVLKCLLQFLSSFTTAEARRFGRFFSVLMHGLEQWRQDDAKFANFLKSPACKLPVGGVLPQITKRSDLCSILRLFRRLLTEIVTICLNSTDPRLQKNSIVFLNQMLSQYPVIKENHECLKSVIDALEMPSESPMEILCKRLTVILDKNYSRCTSKQGYGGVDIFAQRTKAKAKAKPKANPKPKATPKPQSNPKPKAIVASTDKSEKEGTKEKPVAKSKTKEREPTSKAEMDKLLKARLEATQLVQKKSPGETKTRKRSREKEPVPKKQKRKKQKKEE